MPKSLFEFWVRYFPRYSDSAVRRRIGMGPCEYAVVQIHRDLERDFYACCGVSESLRGLVTAPTATELFHYGDNPAGPLKL